MLYRFVLAALLVGAAAPAHAQIYSYLDGEGRLVLSNRKPTGADILRSYAVPKSDSVRVTRYATTDRSTRYDDLIEAQARLNGVRTDLVRAVVQVESAFNPYARSPKGALGLMQLMPATIRQYAVRNPFDPSDNIRAGVAYLRDLLDRYHNDETLALAAYNAGPGAVDKHGQAIPPYRETQNYVAHINQMAGPALAGRTGQIYKVTEIVDGEPRVRYTDKRPASGAYEVVRR